jgi:hypothetical protein
MNRSSFFRRLLPMPMLALALVLLGSAPESGAFADPIDSHPNQKQLKRIFSAPLPADFKSTDVTKADYLKLIAGNVDFFKQYQNADGAIIDPISKGERQYSTPAFAAAAGALAKEAGRHDLLLPATRAFSCALTALIEKRPADGHADFYIPLLVHAFRFLNDIVPPEQAAKWTTQFEQINPETMYRADLRGMNWNIVSSSGELLRRHDGLVAPARLDAQMHYLETCLQGHLPTFTPLGLFQDPNAPMAYDAFSRLWLEDVYANEAYSGTFSQQIGSFLRTGGLSTLLLISPTGEWPTGGRSALHNWNEAQLVAICEMNAVYWKKQGRNDVAGAFKRAGHLAFQSVARWQRPSGEIWIIKNRAEPDKRFAFETYSNHSQYNLLPMAMLAIACNRADDSIAERPTPAEVGGYVFDARQTFHKITAAAGGYYVELDTAADPHYNATGLQRVQKAGVFYSALSDSVAPERAYGPADAPKAAVATGVRWHSGGTDSQWVDLSSFSGTEGARKVRSADLQMEADDPDHTAFKVTYTLIGDGPADRVVTEDYSLTSDGVEQESTVAGTTTALGAHFPLLITDGAAPTEVQNIANDLCITERGSATTVALLGNHSGGTAANTWTLLPAHLVDHAGEIQEATSEASPGRVHLKITLAQGR